MILGTNTDAPKFQFRCRKSAFLRFLPFLTPSPGPKIENFEKMKKCPPDISLDYRITPETNDFDHRLSRKRDPSLPKKSRKIALKRLKMGQLKGWVGRQKNKFFKNTQNHTKKYGMQYVSDPIMGKCETQR